MIGKSRFRSCYFDDSKMKNDKHWVLGSWQGYICGKACILIVDLTPEQTPSEREREGVSRVSLIAGDGDRFGRG
jgi:hypothetical protein